MAKCKTPRVQRSTPPQGQDLDRDLREKEMKARELEAIAAREKCRHEILDLMAMIKYPGVGESEFFRDRLVKVKEAAQNSFPVLICGFEGTGRTTAARAIHNCSRPQQPFESLPCIGATRPEALEKMQKARGGTLVLYDVESLTPELQGVIGQCLRPGDYQTAVRLISITKASNSDFCELMPEGERGFFQRIQTMTISFYTPDKRSAIWPDADILALHILDRIIERNKSYENFPFDHVWMQLQVLYWASPDALSIPEIERLVWETLKQTRDWQQETEIPFQDIERDGINRQSKYYKDLWEFLLALYKANPELNPSLEGKVFAVQPVPVLKKDAPANANVKGSRRKIRSKKQQYAEEVTKAYQKCLDENQTWTCEEAAEQVRLDYEKSGIILTVHQILNWAKGK